MTKAKRIILFVCLAIVALIVLAYLSVVIYYQCSYYKVNGFEIVNSMIYLTVTDKDYVDLGGERYIVKEGGAQSLLDNEFDSYTTESMRFKLAVGYSESEITHWPHDVKGLQAVKDGVRYAYSAGYFDSNKYILMCGEPLEAGKDGAGYDYWD